MASEHFEAIFPISSHSADSEQKGPQKIASSVVKKNGHIDFFLERFTFLPLVYELTLFVSISIFLKRQVQHSSQID
jgi:hypothetical protein